MTETKVSDDHERDIWTDYRTRAETYDTVRSMQVCAHRLVALAALPPGAQVLDIATGTGWVALAAAERVGPTGRVLGVDQSPEMLARAQQKVTAAGVTNVEFRTGDAQRLDLADQCFDVVLCASALMIIPDMRAALKEMHRVLKPGGQVVFSGFGPTYGQPLQDLCNAHLRQYGVSLPEGSPHQRLEEPETCRRLLHEAGFVQTEVQREQLGYYFQTVEEYWEDMWASQRRLTFFFQLPPAQRAQFKAEHLAKVGALATAQGIWRDVDVNFARGWKRPA